MKKLTINDLPEEVVNDMKAAIRKDSQIIALENKRNAFIKSHRYADATQVTNYIKTIENKVIEDWLLTYKGEAERMDKLTNGMSKEDIDEINILSNSIVMLCDMIETFTMDCNAVLHKYHPEYHIEMYDKFNEVGKEAKIQMEFMAKNTNSIYQINFADYADDITELVRNKAKSLIRKLKKEGQAYENN